MILILLTLLPTIFGSDVSNRDISNFFNDIGQFDLEDGISEKCKADLKLYQEEWLDKDWARRMFDSSAKIPESVQKGNRIFIGQFDECIEIDGPNDTFVGQHCMLNLTLKTNIAKFPENLFYGQCLPSSCTVKDVKNLYDGRDINIGSLNINISASIIPDDCRTRDGKSLRAGDWVVVGVLICFLIIAISSTAYDVRQRIHLNNNSPNQLYSAFSFLSNGKTFISITKNSDRIMALNGLRTVSVGWVVLGHAYLNTVKYSPVVNPSNAVDVAQNWGHVVTSNPFMSADSFFLINGMLMCLVFFKSMSSKKSFDAPLNYIYRYLRLTPSYAVIILLEVTLLQYLGDGPMWYKTHHESAENCENYWWSSLLYVQNYVNPKSICLDQTWYLSADMQMFWLSPIILYPLYFWPLFGGILLCLVLLASCWASFAVTYVYNLPPYFVLYPSEDRMTMEYYPTHTRLPPYLIGIALGYLLCGIKAKKFNINLSPFWTTFHWILSTVLMTAAFNAMPYFTQTDSAGEKTYTALDAAFYLGFFRLGWAIGLAWIIFACATGIGGIVNAILSFKFFQPLVKLSYGVYLIHHSLQRFRIGMLRTSVYYQDLDIVYLFVADFIMANLLAIALYLIFERPFFHISRILLEKLKIFPYPKSRKSILEEEDKLQDTPKLPEEDVEEGKNNVAVQLEKEEAEISSNP